MILLKADESMSREDLAPNRMERARLKAADLARARRGQATGLIVYAGSAHLVLPPTRDSEVIASMVQHISPDIMPEPGDRLDDAIALAESIMPKGFIVVIADEFPAIESALPIRRLAVSSTPIGRATMITSDSADIEEIKRKTRGRGGAVNAEDAARWAEAGWWLTPLLGLFSLLSFRREAA